jgi:hypothetical protein
MSTSLTIFLPLNHDDLEPIVEGFKEEFDTLLKDLFTEDELNQLEPKLDAIAAIYTGPVFSELSFEDFYPSPVLENEQKEFFEKCKSTITFENLPFLESNPFQVSYLLELLQKFEEVLVDRGGVYELYFGKDYEKFLSQYKTIDSLLGQPQAREIRPVKSSSIPVDPIDFLIRDVYREIERLKGRAPEGTDLSLKVKRIYSVMREEHLPADELLRKSSLNAKDFDDGLESLKFWLRKHP